MVHRRARAGARARGVGDTGGCARETAAFAPEGNSGLSRDLTQQRAAALARAQDAVRSPRFRALTLDIAAWLEAGQWTRPQDDLVRDRGHLAIETSAAEQLARRFRKSASRARSSPGLMREAATSSASRRRRCVIPRSSSPSFSPAIRRRGDARSSFRRSNACRIAWAISTTSRCTRIGLRPLPIAADKAPPRPLETRLRGRVTDGARGRASRYGPG